MTELHDESFFLFRLRIEFSLAVGIALIRCIIIVNERYYKHMCVWGGGGGPPYIMVRTK